MKEKTSQHRRHFLKYSAAGILALPLLQFISSCTKNQVAELPEGQNAVPANDPTATALGYVTDATKVDTAKYPKRAGADGATQFCNNCNFFTSQNEGWGKCQLISSGLVAQQGWCNSWIKKAGT